MLFNLKRIISSVVMEHAFKSEHSPFVNTASCGEYKKANAFVLFGRAFKNARKDFWVSSVVLLVITFFVSVAFYTVEHVAQPEEYSNPWYSFVWAITRYIGDPGNFAGNGPVTLVGRLLNTFIGILEILIFAVPAGLVANGFREAMDDEKNEEHMSKVRQMIHKCFRKVKSPAFQDYVKAHPEIPDHTYFFVPRKVSVAKLEVKGVKKTDILDAANKYPEIRLKNMATAMSVEDHPDDRLVVELFPLNRDYGFCLDRKSNITIVAPSNSSEVATGWFAYHLAKTGGFNLICKEIEVDPFEPDSFFAMPAQITVNGKTKKQMEGEPKRYKKELELIETKRRRREDFLKDLNSLCNRENGWCVVLTSHIKNQTNTVDLHLSYDLSSGDNPAVNDINAYEQMLDQLKYRMMQDFELVPENSSRYALLKSSLAYKVRKEHPHVNAFSLMVSTDIVNFDARTHSIAWSIASIFNNSFHGQGMLPVDDDDFKQRLFGYDEIENYLN